MDLLPISWEKGFKESKPRCVFENSRQVRGYMGRITTKTVKPELSDFSRRDVPSS